MHSNNVPPIHGSNLVESDHSDEMADNDVFIGGVHPGFGQNGIVNNHHQHSVSNNNNKEQPPDLNRHRANNKSKLNLYFPAI